MVTSEETVHGSPRYHNCIVYMEMLGVAVDYGRKHNHLYRGMWVGKPGGLTYNLTMSRGIVATFKHRISKGKT